MRNDRELAENAAAAGWRLSAEDRSEIDRIFADENSLRTTSGLRPWRRARAPPCSIK
jgi:diketogulonate reductase-like aldo/keto reductase